MSNFIEEWILLDSCFEQKINSLNQKIAIAINQNQSIPIVGKYAVLVKKAEACAKIAELESKIKKAKNLIVSEIDDIGNCSCGAENGSEYGEVICYLHEALKELES